MERRAADMEGRIAGGEWRGCLRERGCRRRRSGTWLCSRAARQSMMGAASRYDDFPVPSLWAATITRAWRKRAIGHTRCRGRRAQRARSASLIADRQPTHSHTLSHAHTSILRPGHTLPRSRVLAARAAGVLPLARAPAAQAHSSRDAAAGRRTRHARQASWVCSTRQSHTKERPRAARTGRRGRLLRGGGRVWPRLAAPHTLGGSLSSSSQRPLSSSLSGSGCTARKCSPSRPSLASSQPSASAMLSGEGRQPP